MTDPRIRNARTGYYLDRLGEFSQFRACCPHTYIVATLSGQRDRFRIKYWLIVCIRIPRCDSRIILTEPRSAAIGPCAVTIMPWMKGWDGSTASRSSSRGPQQLDRFSDGDPPTGKSVAIPGNLSTSSVSDRHPPKPSLDGLGFCNGAEQSSWSSLVKLAGDIQAFTLLIPLQLFITLDGLGARGEETRSEAHHCETFHTPSDNKPDGQPIADIES